MQFLDDLVRSRDKTTRHSVIRGGVGKRANHFEDLTGQGSLLHAANIFQNEPFGVALTNFVAFEFLHGRILKDNRALLLSLGTWPQKTLKLQESFQ